MHSSMDVCLIVTPVGTRMKEEGANIIFDMIYDVFFYEIELIKYFTTK